MQAFRDSVPTRTCTKTYQDYRQYKSYLRDDFHKRCGYCDDRDSRYGGKRSMHIDHFRPKSLFQLLINDYNNLVYSCPYCNNSKSNDWPGNTEESVVGDEGYIDPCDLDYDNHFERDSSGKICPKTPIGWYMFWHLNLCLIRHELAWAYEQLGTRLREVIDLLEQFDDEDAARQQLVEQQLSLTKEFLKYKQLFEDTL